MITFTKEQLTEILAKHKAWINNEDGGEKADLRCADLRCAQPAFLAFSKRKRIGLYECR